MSADPKKFIMSQPEFRSAFERWLIDHGFGRDGNRYRRVLNDGREIEVYKTHAESSNWFARGFGFKGVRR